MRKSPRTLMMKIYNLGDGKRNVEICIGSRVQPFVFLFQLQKLQSSETDISKARQKYLMKSSLFHYLFNNLSVSDEFRQEHGDRFCKWADWSVPQSSPAHKMRFFQKQYLDVVQTFEHHSNVRQMKNWGGTEFRKLLAIKTGHNYFRAKSVSRSELKWPFFKKMSWTWN